MASCKKIHILFTYYRSKLCLVDLDRYEDSKRAVDLYSERERQYADQRHIEVVLLDADSEDAVRATHPTYFRDSEAEPFSMKYEHLPWVALDPTAG